MGGHNFVDVFAQDLLPALWAVRLPYGFPVKRGEKSGPESPSVDGT